MRTHEIFTHLFDMMSVENTNLIRKMVTNTIGGVFSKLKTTGVYDTPTHFSDVGIRLNIRNVTYYSVSSEISFSRTKNLLIFIVKYRVVIACLVAT